MNVRMTIDVPAQHLPALERTLNSAGLAITPYIKAGIQRWQLGPRQNASAPAIPETIVAIGVQELH